MTSPLWLSIKYQFTAIVLIAASLALWDTEVAYSFALGCVIYVVPNCYFVHYAFRHRGAEQIQQIAQSFSWGESGKIALAAIGFILAYRFVKPLHHPSVFFGFFSMIILQWYIAALVARRLDSAGKTVKRDTSSTN